MVSLIFLLLGCCNPPTFSSQSTHTTPSSPLPSPRYTANGMLGMLERDAKVKRAPERFQLQDRVFDIIFTYERHVFDTVVECKYYVFKYMPSPIRRYS